jgi:H+/Cl- antiporter ClcA
MNLLTYLKQTFHSRYLLRNTVAGAFTGLALIGLFRYNAGAPDPDWHPFWMLRPLLIVPFAGAMGGLFFTFMEPWRTKSGWIKSGAYFICLLVILIGLFMGIVLGLDGTYWD